MPNADRGKALKLVRDLSIKALADDTSPEARTCAVMVLKIIAKHNFLVVDTDSKYFVGGKPLPAEPFVDLGKMEGASEEEMIDAVAAQLGLKDATIEQLEQSVKMFHREIQRRRPVGSCIYCGAGIEAGPLIFGRDGRIHMSCMAQYYEARMRQGS